MVDATTAQRAAELRRLIDYHNHRYYVLDQRRSDNAQYDRRMRELLGLEGAHPELVTPNSPSRRVGAQQQSASAPIRNGMAMLSLNNVLNDARLAEFDR